MTLQDMNPLGGANAFAVCVYDTSSPSAQLIAQASVPRDDATAGDPLWTTKGNNRFLYDERPPGPGGVSKLTLRGTRTAPKSLEEYLMSGVETRTSAKVKGAGAGVEVSLSPSPATSVTAQLVVSGNVCWELQSSKVQQSATAIHAK